MSFLKKLFGGGAPKAEAPPPSTEHGGCTILATPYQEGGQWQLCGVIEKEIGGERKSHRFIRADRFAGRDDAVEMTFMKGRQIIDQSATGSSPDRPTDWTQALGSFRCAPSQSGDLAVALQVQKKTFLDSVAVYCIGVNGPP